MTVLSFACGFFAALSIVLALLVYHLHGMLRDMTDVIYAVSEQSAAYEPAFPPSEM